MQISDYGCDVDKDSGRGEGEPYPSPVWYKRRKGATLLTLPAAVFVYYSSTSNSRYCYWYFLGYILLFLGLHFATWRWCHPRRPLSDYGWPMSGLLFCIAGVATGFNVAWLVSRPLAEGAVRYLQRGDLRIFLFYGFFWVLLFPLLSAGAWGFVIIWVRCLRRLLGEERAACVVNSPLFNAGGNSRNNQWLLKNAGYKIGQSS